MFPQHWCGRPDSKSQFCLSDLSISIIEIQVSSLHWHQKNVWSPFVEKLHNSSPAILAIPYINLLGSHCGELFSP